MFCWYLVIFHLGPKAEVHCSYVSPALLLGINFDFSGDDGLEFYPSLSVQAAGGYARDSQLDPVSCICIIPHQSLLPRGRLVNTLPYQKLKISIRS